MSNTLFDRPDLSAFARLDGLGLGVTGQRISRGTVVRPECAHVWRQDVSQATDPRAKVSRAAVRWALTGLRVMGLLPVVCGACTQMRCLGQELHVDVNVVRSSIHVRIVKPAQRSVSTLVPVVADHLSGGVCVVSLLAHGILIRILRGIRIDERTGVDGSIARAVIPRILGV